MQTPFAPAPKNTFSFRCAIYRCTMGGMTLYIRCQPVYPLTIFHSDTVDDTVVGLYCSIFLCPGLTPSIMQDMVVSIQLCMSNVRAPPAAPRAPAPPRP